MPNQDHRAKITLDELLRLKRAERPTPEFWASFERELRQKQLAALVDRRPWWQELPQFLSRRAYIPVGAAAILAFTVVSVRYYAPTPVARVDSTLSPAVAIAVAPAAVSQTPASASIPAQDESPVLTVDDRTAIAANTSLSDTLPERALELTPWSAPRSVDTPSARSIAANMANVEQQEPDLVSTGFGSRPTHQSRAQEAVARTAELAAVSAFASKRSRLLAQFADRHFTPEPQAPEILRERLARRMADQDYNERFSRVDLQADRVLVKF